MRHLKGQVDARGDHRIAMCGLLLAMLAPEGAMVHGTESIRSSFPEFGATLASVGAQVAAP